MQKVMGECPLTINDEYFPGGDKTTDWWVCTEEGINNCVAYPVHDEEHANSIAKIKSGAFCCSWAIRDADKITATGGPGFA